MIYIMDINSIKLYPQMNEKIVELLSMSDNPLELYAASLLREYQKLGTVEQIREILRKEKR